jgi:hypothetical protein
MKFNFNFGSKEKTIFDWVKISLILESILEFVSRTLKIPKDKLWPFIDEIQRELLRRGWIDDTVNEYIIETPELLEQRVKRDVDNAIADYVKQEPEEINMKNETILAEIEKDKYTEEQKKTVKEAIFYEKPPDGSAAQAILGGEMGIKGKWVDKTR